MAKTTVRMAWDRASIAALKTDAEVVAYVDEAARGFALRLREAAPKRTGAGAGSIEARPSRTKGARDVGWDKAHYYMSFQEFYSTFGDDDRTANPNFQFAERALESYIHT